MAKQYVVNAAAVVVKLFGKDRYLYRGAVLPSGVPQKDLTRLRNNGLIVEKAAPQPTPDKDQTPDGDGKSDGAAGGAGDSKDAGDGAEEKKAPARGTSNRSQK